MGIKFTCPNGHKLNVKSFLAGRRGICPQCEARFRIPLESGGAAEPISKGERGGDETRLTSQMQDDAPGQDYPAGIPVGVGVAGGGYPTAAPVGMTTGGVPTGSPLGMGVIPMAGQVAAQQRPDPFQEAPHAVWYVRPRSGGQYGPAAGEIMRSWIDEGRVAGDSLVWCEGWPDWKPASAVFPKLGSPVPTTAAPIMGSVAIAQSAAPIGGVPRGTPTAAAAGALPVGNVVGSGFPQAAAVAASPAGFAAGAPAGTPAASPLNRRAATRRSSKNLTAIIVLFLIFVAIVLAAVFGWVLFGREKAAPPATARTALKAPTLNYPVNTGRSSAT